MASDNYCNGCIYKGVVEGHVPCCNYIFIEDKRRPCPPGDGCTVKVEGRYKQTVEERRAARARRQKERRDKVRAAKMQTVICPICGQEFQTANPKKKYCSKQCRDKSIKLWRKRRKNNG